MFAGILLFRMVGSIYERQRDRAAAIGPVAPVPGSGPDGDELDDEDEPVESAPESVFVHAVDAQAIGRY